MIKPKDIDLKELEDKGLCTECGAIIHTTDHYCESCKSRVAVAVEIEPVVLFFKQYLSDKLNRIEKEIDERKMEALNRFFNKGFPSATIKLIEKEYDEFKQIIHREFTLK